MAKAAIFAALLHAPTQRRRSADRTVLAFMAATIVGLGTATGIALAFATAKPEPLPAVLHYQIGQTALTAPREWLRAPIAGEGRIERLELIIDWPRSNAAPQHDDAANGSLLDRSVLISLGPADPLSAPSERLNRTYSRFVDTKPEPGPAGLISYSFKAGSRYANERLLVAAQGFATTDGEAFFVRCPQNEDAQKGSPADLCTTTLHIGMLDAVVRFSPARLSEWPHLSDGVKRIVSALIHGQAHRP
ncbi:MULTISPECIES: hypothetical protein [unclassified Chelatococcus]|uniref:hypothetical protein n=1 Tax=unclassified Chelatococcus TaxID=2638111 RepID=UPI001BD18553|nr:MULTISPECIES: hypothetical protein [unclassified Chelatococcus]MBS7698111.1 hypothetical protein [Chelatococcus sp. YT9]MBX3556571.1 hypothetical protein [Chelatococcus sp.]